MTHELEDAQVLRIRDIRMFSEQYRGEWASLDYGHRRL
jgi:hypothetical protein